MSRTTKAALLTAALAALPATAPSHALPMESGCHFVAFRDVTDQSGLDTWIELTYSSFVGTPDVTSFEVTCWLQTSADQGVGELTNTRHTCSGASSAGVCANPVIFSVDASGSLYQCQHLEWVGSITGPPVGAPDLVEHLLADLFSTGGVTTLGTGALTTIGVGELIDTVQLAVNGLIDTLQALVPPGLPGPLTNHTITYDYDDNVPGVQCKAATKSQNLIAFD